MEVVDVLVGRVQVWHGNNITQFTVLVPKSPAVSPDPPLEVHISVETDNNPFYIHRYLDAVCMKILLQLM
jgi:hypothetical protein